MSKLKFINKQLYEIKRGGKVILFRKIFTAVKSILLIPNYFFATLLLIFIYLISPWFLVRFGHLMSSRFGHFALNTEDYLSRKELGINAPSRPYLDLFFYKVISNRQLAKMWKRELNVLPAWLLSPFFNI